MANNPYVNKVQTADGTVLMDVTDTTAEAGDVRSGEVFYTASGARSVGTMSAVGNTSVWVGTSDTAAATRDKAVTITGVTEYKTGDVFVITFTNAQDYNGAPRLNINSLGVKTIRRVTGTSATRYQWLAGEAQIMIYDGTYMVLVNNGFATTTYYGLTKLTSSCTSTSSGMALTASALNAYSERMVAGAALYSSDSTYEVGDKVRSGWYIYECNTPITEAEEWNAEHWTQLPALQTQIDNMDQTIGDYTWADLGYQ